MPGTLRAKRSALPTCLRTHNCSLRPLDTRGFSPGLLPGLSSLSPGPALRGHGPLSTSASPSSRCRAVGSPGRTIGEGSPSPRGSAGEELEAACLRLDGARVAVGCRPGWPPAAPWGHSPGQTCGGLGRPWQKTGGWGPGPGRGRKNPAWRLLGRVAGVASAPPACSRHITPLLGLRAPLREGVKECWATWQAGNQPLGPGFCRATMPSGEGFSQSPSGCSVPAHPGSAFRNPLAGSDADGACQGGGGKRGP